MQNKIVTLLYEPMTAQQQTHANQQCRIHPNFVMRAIEWLVEYNDEWKDRNINMHNIRQTLRQLALVNDSCVEDAMDSNIENTETFEVYFPDGTMTELNGGQESLSKFQDLVVQSLQNGFDPASWCNLEKSVCYDHNKDNNFVNSCLLQFPFDVGGPDELWKKPDSSFVISSIDMGKYAEHLSRFSIKYFQKELFTLQLYNIIMKQWMLHSVTFRLRNKTTVNKFANNLSEEDIRDVLQKKKKNQSSFTGGFRYCPATQFISAIDAITAYLLHTNAAARKPYHYRVFAASFWCCNISHNNKSR